MYGTHRFGSENPFFGKRHSEETKEKIRKAKLGKILPTRQKEKISKALKGRKAIWLIGKKLSEEHRKKMSIARKGRKFTIEHRTKLSKAQKGNKSHFWKGGVTNSNLLLRNSLEYRLWREAVFRRDDYICKWCGQRGGELNADHIKPFSLFPELRFAIDNGRTLCKECHKKTDTYAAKVKKIISNNR